MADEKLESQEVDEKDLNGVAGGSGEPVQTCPKCGANSWTLISPPPMVMYSCDVCGEEIFVEV